MDYIVLQITAGSITWTQLIEFILKVVSVLILVWSVYSAFSKKANKDDMEKALEQKVNVTRFDDYKLHIQGELDRHDEMFETIVDKIEQDARERKITNDLLSRIDERVSYIKDNCPKLKC